MGKIPPKFYKIGEVMAHTGISRQTIHDYTVGGFIEEDARTPAGHRLYGEWVFERLARIRLLQDQGHSLKGIKTMIDEQKI
ncbi:MAG: MerR family transcriptional regulator [Planctomycetota bacterium]|nr:MerR family transcriptional regulator [Planctomycetota bacterium]